MRVSEVRRLSDDALRAGLKELANQDRTCTVRLLIHIAEFQARRLYREAAYKSMNEYCVGELRMSSDMAYKRCRVARCARRWPSIYVGIAEGSLSVTGLTMLSKHMTEANGTDLLTAAEGKTNDEIAALIAERFPRPDLPFLIQPLSPAPVFVTSTEAMPGMNCQELAAPPIPTATPRPPITPIAPERFVMRITVGGSLKEKLEHAKHLLGHRAPNTSEEEVLERALDALIGLLEKRKYGATDRPHTSSHQSKNPRHIPAQVRRAVSERDQGRCTFVAANGRRCEGRGCLEFDHIEPVARGGRSTASNLRLRCRAHNQYTAEKTYGAEFMRAKIDQAHRERPEANVHAPA